MGYLKIIKVSYVGDNYYYKSPKFENGINIVEGVNGSGKSTFIDLISYGLGCYVEHFTKSKTSIHKEICSDTNNYVELIIKINNSKYVLKRFIGTTEILIKDTNEKIIILDINRSNKDDYVFSDWILDNLGIEKIDIYQNTYSGILSFDELYRLIHYEQKSNPSKIYKESKNDGNFVSDSILRRKAIFEVLMGKNLTEYYASINNYKKYEKENTSDKNTLKTFKSSIEELYGIDISEESDNETKIHNLKNELESIDKKIDDLSLENEYTDDVFSQELEDIRNEITKLSLESRKEKEKFNNLILELDNINALIENKEIEISQINKIIFTHKELNIFSPNTCPYCFNSVNREKGFCLCGNEIDENYFERSFYNAEEYLKMIKQKKKSLITLIQGRESIITDINKSTENIYKYNENLKYKEKLMKSISRDTKLNYNLTGIKRLSSEMLKVKADLKQAEEIHSLYTKYKILHKKVIDSGNSLKDAKEEMIKQDKLASDSIQDMIKKFSTEYEKLMKKVIGDCKNAKIDSDYMPVLNDGVYINASVEVQKKLVYFITLLKLSLTEDVNFPRLLIIDTPESLGIDENNLNLTLSLLETLNFKKPFQVILTTGINKFPNSRKFIVKQTMTKEKSLLKKKSFTTKQL